VGLYLLFPDLKDNSLTVVIVKVFFHLGISVEIDGKGDYSYDTQDYSQVKSIF